jgi:exodeoxyribonuclease VII large subunit
MQEVRSLLELNEFIRRVIALNFQEQLWVTAEIAQVGTTRGHRYIELVQHGADGVIAQLQAVLWQGEYRKMKIGLGDTIDQLLVGGTQIKIAISVSFHEKYGLKAQIHEIDAEWTLGNLELQKRKTIELLQQRGLMHANRRKPMPLVLQHLAIISSEKAAGFQDFMQQLSQNQYGYAFTIAFFDTLVQGPNAEAEMIKALKEIELESEQYDAVVIVRGGGARLDLAVFDQLQLNLQVADMSIPVLVGIGHDTDQTVLDLVAHTALKTPTAVAEFIVQKNMQYEAALLQMAAQMIRTAEHTLNQAEQRLEMVALQLKHGLGTLHQSEVWRVEGVGAHLPKAIQKYFDQLELQLDTLHNRLQIMHPKSVLARGFTITRYKNKAIASADTVPVGAKLETETADGRFDAIKL